jgi:L-lactate dehydrogenase complex protein LldG
VTVREQILARIAANLRRTRPTSTASSHAHRVPARAAVEQKKPALPLRERFTTELQLLGGHVHALASPADAVRLITDLCAQHHASRVLAWDERFVGLPGLRSSLSEHRIGYDTGWLPPEDSARRDRLAGLEKVSVGVTGAIGAIAESGTIALVSGPGRPRLASLLPPVHVAVLPVDAIYASLSELLSAHPRTTDEGSNLVLISGPSRTADIEMTLTRGVHGPGEVHVILLGT